MEIDERVAHLIGMPLPPLTLASTTGCDVTLAEASAGCAILYFYPLSTPADGQAPVGWDEIPGARGCTSEACDFRDHFAELQRHGATFVAGISSQPTVYQQELATRLHLPFAMLSDANFALADTLGLPMFATPEHPRLHRRLTLVVRHGVIEHVFFPIDTPSAHGGEVALWLSENL